MAWATKKKTILLTTDDGELFGMRREKVNNIYIYIYIYG